MYRHKAESACISSECQTETGALPMDAVESTAMPIEDAINDSWAVPVWALLVCYLSSTDELLCKRNQQNYRWYHYYRENHYAEPWCNELGAKV